MDAKPHLAPILANAKRADKLAKDAITSANDVVNV